MNGWGKTKGEQSECDGAVAVTNDNEASEVDKDKKNDAGDAAVESDDDDSLADLDGLPKGFLTQSVEVSEGREGDAAAAGAGKKDDVPEIEIKEARKQAANITDVTDEVTDKVADEDATDKTKAATPPPPPSVQGVFRTNSLF